MSSSVNLLGDTKCSITGGYFVYEDPNNYVKEPLIDIYNRAVNALNYREFYPELIKDVQFFPQAVKMTFWNGTTTVAKLQEGDEYSKETGMMICIMEYIYGGKQYNNTFRKWIKNDEKRKADKIAAEKRAEEEKKVKERQAAKEARKKAARKEKKMKEAVEIQKEAYRQAWEEENKAQRWWFSTTDNVVPLNYNECDTDCDADCEEISVTASRLDKDPEERKLSSDRPISSDNGKFYGELKGSN